MRKHFLTLFITLFAAQGFAQKTPTVFIDSKGTMRWSDSRKEAVFYGVNYTLPFAHAYRGMNYLGIDHKKAIDRDVYHFARLGFNAYRIHVWDVEICDSIGNLKENDHLRLLDYLFMRLRERGIRIVVTAQTNFGNGYPERNQPTGGYSYDYDKCDVHQNPKAIAAQERYIAALVNHVNPYTGVSYKDDPYIIGFEINNEPCHPGTKDQTKSYINRMLGALKKAGNKKPVFYNVSHNQHVVEAYYDTAVQGTTYQWYPTGLVAGHTRKGNFLPHVDAYHIPFSNVRNFGKKALMIYEFDPADVMYSHLYPAVSRTLRSTGFQWITQFAYDPIDMAYANTEYQTHFLNLAYTPGKAISMKIAAEVAQSVRKGDSFGSYPADTLFKDFRVSYSQDLSELNRPTAFFYSNNTQTQPVAPRELQAVAGCGSSPVVSYEGTGAYFLDKLEEGVWRLEVMPDAVQVSDPFAKPSLKKEVVAVISRAWDMKLSVPDLSESFSAQALNAANTRSFTATNGTLSNLTPGVYLLVRKDTKPSDDWTAEKRWKNIKLGEFVAPAEKKCDSYRVVNYTPKIYETGKELTLKVQLAGWEQPDSLIVYTDQISFWNEHNPYKKMTRKQGAIYEVAVPAAEVKEGVFRYNIVAFNKGKRQTFPGGKEGTPLDWDYIGDQYWETRVVNPSAEISLVAPSVSSQWNGVEQYTVPQEGGACFLRKYIRDEVAGRESKLQQVQYLCVQLKGKVNGVEAGFITSDGFTYKAKGNTSQEGILRLPLSALKQTATTLLPHAYPVFLDKQFKSTTNIPFEVQKIESLEVSHLTENLVLEKAWIE